MSEYAPGQFEITLEHRADALRAVDEAILFKRVVRGVAARHGRVACFMAKPFAERAGSGMHLHASLADDERRQRLFASDDAERQPRCCGTRSAACGDDGGRHGGLRAEREFVSSLPLDELRARRRRPGASTTAP